MARKATRTAVTGTIEEQIASLANALWRERGCPDGSAEQDWFDAERKLESERKTEIVKVVRRARRSETSAAV